MTIRLSLTASSPHSNAGHAGGNSIELTGSSWPALLRHVQNMFNERPWHSQGWTRVRMSVKPQEPVSGRG
eukprot:scaffold6379_cov62-Phaeocystis_antarctica.AAC.1